MNTLDIILGGILLIAFFLGFRKGFVASFLSFLRFFIAGYVAVYYGPTLHPYMYWLGEQKEVVYQIAAFILCFILASIALWLLAKFLTKFIDFLTLGVLNRLLGATFTVLKYALLISLSLFLLDKIDTNKAYITEAQAEDSFLYMPIASIAPAILPLVSEFIVEVSQEE